MFKHCKRTMPLEDLLYTTLLGESRLFVSPLFRGSPPFIRYGSLQHLQTIASLCFTKKQKNHILALTNTTFQCRRNRHPPQRRQDAPLLRPLHRHQRQRARNPNRLRLIRHPARRRLVLVPDHSAARHSRQSPRPPHRRRRHPHRQDGRRQRRISYFAC